LRRPCSFGIELDLTAFPGVVTPEMPGKEVADLREAIGQGVVLAIQRDLEQALENPALDEELDGRGLDGPVHLALAIAHEDLSARLGHR
jgi:hypothetical protein